MQRPSLTISDVFLSLAKPGRLVSEGLLLQELRNPVRWSQGKAVRLDRGLLHRRQHGSSTASRTSATSASGFNDILVTMLSKVNDRRSHLAGARDSFRCWGSSRSGEGQGSAVGKSAAGTVGRRKARSKWYFVDQEMGWDGTGWERESRSLTAL
jgi:hypothetical protein